MAIWKKYPYTDFHDLNLDWIIKIVKELKEIVDQIDIEEINRRFGEINAELTEHETEIHELQSAIPVLSDTLRTLSGIVANHTDDLASIHSQIDGVIDSISEAVTQLQGEIGDLETDYNAFKTATNTAIDNLNQAAFDPSQIVMSNMPFNFALSTLNGNKNGLRIVVDGSGSPADSIQWVDGGQFKPYGIPEKQKFNTPFKIPRFYSSGNPCHLIVPSIFPIVYRANVNWSLYFYANRWIGESSNNIGIAKVGAINFTDLLTAGGYSKSGASDSGSACFNEMELFANEDTGCYDLHIFNGRNGHYAWINDYMFSSIMILPIDLGNMTQAPNIQKYFNLLNTFNVQSMSDVDGRITSAISSALTPINASIATINEKFGNYTETNHLISETFTPETGVTLVNNRSFSSQSIVVDDLDRVKMVSYLYIDLVLDITDLTSVDLTVGSFDLSLYPLIGGRNINVTTQSPNNGCYGTIGQTGEVAIHCNGTFTSTTRVRITATCVDNHVVQ